VSSATAAAEVGAEIEVISADSGSSADLIADLEAEVSPEFESFPAVALKGRRRLVKKATLVKRARVAKKG
jgi:hypothetical protein